VDHGLFLNSDPGPGPFPHHIGHMQPPFPLPYRFVCSWPCGGGCTPTAEPRPIGTPPFPLHSPTVRSNMYNVPTILCFKSHTDFDLVVSPPRSNASHTITGLLIRCFRVGAMVARCFPVFWVSYLDGVNQTGKGCGFEVREILMSRSKTAVLTSHS